MMDKIMIVISPMEIRQGVYVYKDEEMTHRDSVITGELTEKLLYLIDKYNVYDLDFVGFQPFAKKFGDEILRESVTKYGKGKVIVDYSR
jgi:hypothetical protein